MRKGRAFDALALATSLLLFGLFSLRQLDLPGLYYDEAADAVPAMQLLLGQPVELVNQTGLTLGDLTLPVMAMDYVGAVNTYLLVPFFALLGVDVIPLRLLTVLGSALTIVFSYLVAQKLFDRRIAAVTSILLAVHPSFVFWSRQGIHVSSIMTVMSTASLLCLLVWWNKGRAVYLYLAAFLLGLGLSAKLLFLWYVLALAACAVLLLAIPMLVSRLRGERSSFTGASGDSRAQRRADAVRAGFKPAPAKAGQSDAISLSAAATSEKRDGGQDDPGRTARPGSPAMGAFQIVFSFVAFLLGAWMILLYNLLTGGTIAILSKNFFSTSYGVNNFALFDNFSTSLGAFRNFLAGEDFWYLGGSFADDWYPRAFAVSVVGTLLLLFHRRSRRLWRTMLFPLAMIGIVFVQSNFTVSGLWATHYFVLYPFPQLTIAAFAVTLVRVLPLKKVTVAIAALAIASLIANDAYVNSRYHAVLSETGGLVTHSDAIYGLADYLDGRGIAEPMAMDWGIKSSVQILTRGRINPIEIFQYENDPSPVFLDWLYGALTKRPETLYVFHAEGREVFPRYQAFLSLARKLDKAVTLEQIIPQRDGSPLYTVYSAK